MLAVVVLTIVVVELTGHRSWPIEFVQVLVIAGIIIAVAFDVRDIRRQRHGQYESLPK
ncbi:MAG TPA: hypothetical protein VMU68_00645 [Acidimicrobiales bacterium]|nr:hypothetical protein [Acidimicrobiales bacterium]